MTSSADVGEETIMNEVTIGTHLPDIALVSPGGQPGTLHAALGGRPAVVLFYRSATCPVCAAHARTLAALQADGSLGDRTLVLVVPGGATEAARTAGRQTPGADLSVWASGDGHAEVGLGRLLALQRSGVFVLDDDGAVTYRRSAAVPLWSLDRSELLAAVS
jgi:peroxiredoxin